MFRMISSPAADCMKSLTKLGSTVLMILVAPRPPDELPPILATPPANPARLIRGTKEPLMIDWIIPVPYCRTRRAGIMPSPWEASIGIESETPVPGPDKMPPSACLRNPPKSPPSPPVLASSPPPNPRGRRMYLSKSDCAIALAIPSNKPDSIFLNASPMLSVPLMIVVRKSENAPPICELTPLAKSSNSELRSFRRVEIWFFVSAIFCATSGSS
jgi:hypothetical protein